MKSPIYAQSPSPREIHREILFYFVLTWFRVLGKTLFWQRKSVAMTKVDTKVVSNILICSITLPLKPSSKTVTLITLS